MARKLGTRNRAFQGYYGHMTSNCTELAKSLQYLGWIERFRIVPVGEVLGSLMYHRECGAVLLVSPLRGKDTIKVQSFPNEESFNKKDRPSVVQYLNYDDALVFIHRWGGINKTEKIANFDPNKPKERIQKVIEYRIPEEIKHMLKIFESSVYVKEVLQRDMLEKSWKSLYNSILKVKKACEEHDATT